MERARSLKQHEEGVGRKWTVPQGDKNGRSRKGIPFGHRQWTVSQGFILRRLRIPCRFAQKCQENPHVAFAPGVIRHLIEKKIKRKCQENVRF